MLIIRYKLRDGGMGKGSRSNFHPVDYFLREEEIVRGRAQSTQQHFKKCLKFLHIFALQRNI